jgi:thioredoxin reductase (NADPH)
MSEKQYDLIIIGGGPAGLSAAIYARRANLDTLLIEKGILGGQIFQTAEIENYPGGIKGESGEAFTRRLSEQAESFGFEKLIDEVREVSFTAENKTVACTSGTYRSKAVIIATGNVPMQLGVPGEDRFAGRGLSYCATCDAPFFKDLEVYVVGGGNSAVEEALHLAKFARNVTIIHRRDELRADKSIRDKAVNTENVHFLFDTVLREVQGGDFVERIVVENVRTGVVSEIAAPESDGVMGVFIFVGATPQTGLFSGILDMEDGYIVTNEDMRTNIPGVFAVGDVRKKSLRQVVTAVADGAVAAVQTEKDLSQIE